MGKLTASVGWTGVAVSVFCATLSSRAAAIDGPPFEFAFIQADEDQADSPAYDYRVALHEVTQAQYVEFLNDARDNLDNPKGFYLYFNSQTGDVYISGDQEGHIGVGTGAPLIFSVSLNPFVSYDGTGGEYVVTSGFEDHPVTGVTWYGAVKYCNWLTLHTGLAKEDRAYAEAIASELEGWHPVTIETTDWAVRDLDDDERDALIEKLGYRLPMDGGDGAGDPSPYNEWYRAAAWDGDLGAYHTFGFGRDVIEDADANFRCSHDPFEDEFDCIEGGTTPVGFYDGRFADGFLTRADENAYGLFDMSGNVWEWMQDQSFDPNDRRNRGGSWRSSASSLQASPGAERSAGVANDSTGFRVAQVVPGALLVAPNKELVNDGWWGGPYTEEDTSVTYLVTNVTNQPLELTVSVDEEWVLITDGLGDTPIEPGASVEVTATIAPACAHEMVVGLNVSTVTFENDLDGTTIDRVFRVTVVEPLTLAPSGSFEATMFFGETEPTKVYALSSESDAVVEWSVTWEDTTVPPTELEWLVVRESESGYVVPGGTTDLTVSFDATDLEVGVYTALLSIMDDCTATTFLVAVSLEIKPPFSVTPAGEQAFAGVVGGPFRPEEHVYTLTNRFAGDVGWSVSIEPVEPDSSADWLEVFPLNGILTWLDEEFDVSVAITEGATDEEVGEHSARLLFTQPSTGFMIERFITLDVRDLLVEPLTDVTFKGPRGGPFIPATFSYTLTNTGLTEMPWTASFVETSDPPSGVDWLDIAPVQGTILDPDDTIEIRLTISAEASLLPEREGGYAGELTITSTAPEPNVFAVRGVSLVVGPEPVALDLVDVPADHDQPGGPDYLFRIGRYEVSNAEFVRFLNDARAHEGDGDPRGAFLSHDTANVRVTLTGDGTPLFEGNVGEAIGFLGGQYVVLDNKQEYPVAGVSWFGAVKYCNWLTWIQGMTDPDQRCYSEGATYGDWAPFMAADQIIDRRGYRLPMDHQSATASEYNEWYKAAAWNPPTRHNSVYGYGRDSLENADANFLHSGDPFEPGTSSRGYYNGVNTLSDDTSTNGTDNAYGLCDLTGNVAEWMHDADGTTGAHAIRGGHFNNVESSPTLRTDMRIALLPESTLSHVGFRVVQVYEPAPIILSQSAIRTTGFVGGTFAPDALVLSIENLAAHTLDRISVSSSAIWLLPEGLPPWQTAPGETLDVLLRPSEVAGLLGVTSPPPGDFVYISREDAQPNGPAHDFWINRTEVTNDQFAAFLNDVRADMLSDTPDERSWYVYLDTRTGSVYINTQRDGQSGTSPPSSALLYDASKGRVSWEGYEYEAKPGYGAHPIVGVTWYGAVKYCNWLSMFTGIPPALRAYAESASDNLDGWHPATMTDLEWTTTSMGNVQRARWIEDTVGYRLPMDDQSAGASLYNEWHRAAAWDHEGADGVGLEHIYGFGRDALTPADANYIHSGDTEFDGTTPVRFFNGANVLYNPILTCPPQTPDTTTNDNDNVHGLYDMCGNVAEWTQDHYDFATDPTLRALRGGRWRSIEGSPELRVDGRAFQPAGQPSDDVGFRVVRGTGRHAAVTIGDPTVEDSYRGYFITEACEPLIVTPQDEIELTGKYGASFSGAEQQYTVKNRSASEMDWQVTVDQGWVDVVGPVPDEWDGTLEGGEAIMIHVATNDLAEDLGPGEHVARVIIRNNTTGQSVSRTVSIDVLQPIGFVPMSATSGFEGYWLGPFDQPEETLTYSLSTRVAFDLEYTVSTDQPWVKLEPEGALTGMLHPNDVVLIDVSVDEAAETLGVGEYSATVRFSFTDTENENLTSWLEKSVTLTVIDPVVVVGAVEDWPGQANPDPATTSPYVFSVSSEADAPIDVFVSTNVDWLDILPDALELLQGQPNEVQVLLNENATQLHDGTYSGRVLFEDGVTGSEQCFPVTLVIEETMSVGPFGGVVAAGVAGGGILPSVMTYTLTNVERGDPADVHWAVTTVPADVPWIRLNGSPSASGVLGEGESTAILIYLDGAGTAGLSEGMYVAELRFDDGTGAAPVTRRIELSIAVPAFETAEVGIAASATQPAGPMYAFAIGEAHTTNAEYAGFLNDALAGLSDDRGAYMYFDAATGDVYVNSGMAGSIGEGAGSRVLRMFSPGVGEQIEWVEGEYRVAQSPVDYSDHPVTGVSWYGALKFCNWLTVDQGMPRAERCYVENTDANPVEWRPVVVSRAAWEESDLDNEERGTLVSGCRGYRLPMDNGWNNPGPSSDFADPYNEWFKAAAWSGSLGRNTVYGFGSDTLDGTLANYEDSGDAFDNGTTPGRAYDANELGLFDMTGNVFDWMQGRFSAHPDSIAYRTIRGGSWDSPETSTSLRVDSRMFTSPGQTDSRIGFRVVRASARKTGDVDHDGDVDVRDFAAIGVCLTGPGGSVMVGCGGFDLDGDMDVDLRDIAAWQGAFTGAGD